MCARLRCRLRLGSSSVRVQCKLTSSVYCTCHGTVPGAPSTQKARTFTSPVDPGPENRSETASAARVPALRFNLESTHVPGHSGSRVVQGQDGLGRVWESEFWAENNLRIQSELYTHSEVVSSPK